MEKQNLSTEHDYFDSLPCLLLTSNQQLVLFSELFTPFFKSCFSNSKFIALEMKFLGSIALMIENVINLEEEKVLLQE